MKQKLILLFSIVCGIAAMVLVKVYIRKEIAKMEARWELVQVITSRKDITPGTVLDAASISDLVGISSIPKRNYTSRNVLATDFENIKGRKVQNLVPKGGNLMWSDISGEEAHGGGLAAMVQSGDRAVSIPVDMTSSVTGLVEPSDHVDILGTFTFPSAKGDPQLDTVTLTILQNVTVLATGKDTTRTLMESGVRGGARRGGSYSTVTLLVTPKEAEMLVFAMQKGRLTLTLRNVSDVGSARDLSNINFNYLEKKVGEFNDARQERLKGTTP